MGGAAPGYFHFNTDALPARDRIGTYCEELVRRWNGLDARTADEARFYAELQLRLFGEVGIGHSANSRIDFFRTPDLMRDGDDTLCALLLTSGSACAMQDDRDHALASGDGIVCDNGYAGGFSYIDESQSWCIRIPRQQLARRLPGSFRFAGAKLDRHPTAHRLLLGYVGAAFDIDFSGDERARAVYEAHILDLIALALGIEGDECVQAEARGGRAARRAAILRAIERRSGDPALTAVTVAASLGVTPRYVHLLLEETGRSFTHHLLEQRLARAAALLRDPDRSDRRVTDIAADTGFGDLSYFGRTFRHRYGVTPSDMREAARRERAK
jgi:AraC-like DNA-binding protein